MSDKAMFILGFFTIVVAVPAFFGVCGQAFKHWLKHKERMVDAMSAQTAEKAAQYAAQTQRLEQRVRVLERIITDRGHGLAGEIEDLRDAPPTLTNREH